MAADLNIIGCAGMRSLAGGLVTVCAPYRDEYQFRSTPRHDRSVNYYRFASQSVRRASRVSRSTSTVITIIYIMYPGHNNIIMLHRCCRKGHVLLEVAYPACVPRSDYTTTCTSHQISSAWLSGNGSEGSGQVRRAEVGFTTK